VEAARAVAASALACGAADEQLQQVFRRVLSRTPADAELATLRRLYEAQRARFRENEAAAKELVSVGASPAGRTADPREAAALAVVAHALMNTDEFVTRR